MFDRKTLKSRAKLTLSRSYISVLIACVIVNFAGSAATGLLSGRIRKLYSLNLADMPNYRLIGIMAVIAAMAVVTLALNIAVISPLKVGLKYFMLRTEDDDTRFDNLLFPFRSNYKNITLTVFLKNLFVGLWSLLGYIPLAVGVWKFGLAEKIMLLLQKADTVTFGEIFSLGGTMFLFLAFTFLFSVPALIKQLQYSLTEYIMAENFDLSPMAAIGKSKEMMVGNKWAYVKLVLSFIPWYIAANLFCCIGNFLLTPYIEATFAQLYMELSGKNGDVYN